MFKISHAILAVGLAVPALAIAQTPLEISNGVLTTSRGMTLYTFDKDAKGKSACNGKCAKNWPPFMVPEGDNAKGAYSIVIRKDGKKQWAYKGQPLYRFAKDMKTGDMTGDGVNNVWHIARPS